MKTSKIPLYIYFICCFFAIISDIFKLEGLTLFTFPLILPSLFFYYFIETKKISVLVCLFLAANFIGDSIGLMDFDNEIYYIIPPFFISNLIMVIVMLKNIEKFKFNVLNIISLVIIGSFLSYILYTVEELFSFGEGHIQIQVGIFGVLLILLALLASYNVIWKINSSNLFLMFSASCVVISDTFYIIFNFQNQLFVLDSIHFTCQILSYFFFIKYILLREEKIAIPS